MENNSDTLERVAGWTKAGEVENSDPCLKLLHSNSILARELYPSGSFSSQEAVAKRADFLSQKPWDRIFLHELLKSQLSKNPTAAQLHSLEQAKDSKSLFVLTGQQPGLFGGPAYSLYKAWGAIALAQHSAKTLQRPVIPLFWIAGDDSDLLECNQVELLDQPSARGKPSNILNMNFSQPRTTLAVASREIESQSDFWNSLETQVGEIWSQSLKTCLHDCYSPGRNLAEAFQLFAESCLGEQGILFLNAFSPEMRMASQSPLRNIAHYHKQLEECITISSQLCEQAGIGIQVPLRKGLIHLFKWEGAQRNRLESISQISSDTQLSHDALSRPLLIESLFPVLGHSLGPAELRYFAQLGGAFQSLTGGAPLVQARPRLTILSETEFKLSESLGMNSFDMIRYSAGDWKDCLLQIVKSETVLKEPSNSEKLLWTELEKLNFNDFWAKLEEIHSQIAGHDTSALTAFKGRFDATWFRYRRSLLKQTLREQLQNPQSKSSAVEQLARWMGRGRPQDRHLWWPSLLNRTGKEALISLGNQISAHSDSQQIWVHESKERSQNRLGKN